MAETKTWRVREVTKFHSDDGSTTLEALEIWHGDTLICEDVDSEEHARLIAAAPDLLEALKRVASGGSFSCFVDAEWDLINAAIAKATAPALTQPGTAQ